MRAAGLLVGLALALALALVLVTAAAGERRRARRCARLARSAAKREAANGGGFARAGYCPSRCYQRYCRCPVSSCRRRCPYNRGKSVYDGKDWYGPRYGECGWRGGF